MNKYVMPELPLQFDVEDKAILKQANLAHRQLAELKGIGCFAFDGFDLP